MRRIADLHAGEAKTDARDAYIIAEAARSLPHTLRSLKVADSQLAELTMLCGFDEDLAGQITQVSNRIRGLLTQIHPATYQFGDIFRLKMRVHAETPMTPGVATAAPITTPIKASGCKRRARSTLNTVAAPPA